MSKQPRYYQVDCKSAVEKALLRGVKKQLVTMPGGTGKTFTAIHAVRNIGRVCWIAPAEELLDQTAFALLVEIDIIPVERLTIIFERHEGSIISILRNKSRDPDIWAIQSQLGVIKADNFNIEPPFVVASAQTLYRRLNVIPADHFKVIVADEADLFFSRTFRQPLETLQFDLLLGLTATPIRADGVLMDDIFTETVYDYPIRQAIKDGYLCELNGIVVKTSTNLDKVATRGGDFVESELSGKVNTPERNNKIVTKYLEHCEGQQFMAHACDVQHAIDLSETFEERGISCKFVVADKSLTLDRKGIVKAYKSGDIMGLTNVGIFSAGFDYPNMGAVIMARPTKSKRLFLQQLFRVTRLKDESFVSRFGQIGTILDIVDGSSKHQLINTHELDKELPIEERIFLSSANRELLLKARQERMMQEVAQEKKVQLFNVPGFSIAFGNESFKPIGDTQKLWLRANGFDLNNSYTMHQFHQLFYASQAPEHEIIYLKEQGYNVSGSLTMGQLVAAKKEIEKRK